MRGREKLPGLVSKVYVALFGTALVLMAMTPDSEFRAIFAVFVTLPWSALFLALADPALPEEGGGTVWAGLVAVFAGAAINAYLLYWVTKFMVRWRGKMRAGK